jgi:enoyl-CoA hydratase/carnithine racemase
MTFQDIIVDREAVWIEIRINRPDKLNSLRENTTEEVLGILEEVEHDRNVRAMILSGNEKGVLHWNRYQRVSDRRRRLLRFLSFSQAR